MLTPLEPPNNRRRKISTYDLEWYPDRIRRKKGEPAPSDVLRLCGVYDGENGYRPYKTIADFIESELTSENQGRWFYAHAGGLADVQFVLEHFYKTRGYHVTAIFSGSSAVVVRVQKSGHTWLLIDSYFTLKAKLDEIGDWLGMAKGSIAFDTESWTELCEYNELDCRILWTALTTFEDIVVDKLGSELNATLASTSLRLLRRRYLKRPIQTSHPLNERLRSAYGGGRTEVHRYGSIRHPGVVYDINAAYPAAMTQPLPGRLRRKFSKIPDWDCEYIANVTLDVPETINVPPLPLVAQGSLFFPVGRFTQTWICRPELERALSLGCKIKKVHEALVFERMMDFGAFAQDLYDMRLKAQKENKIGYLQAVLKLLMNALYGKTGEQSQKQTLMINPTAADLRMAKSYHQLEKGHLSRVRSGVFLLEVEHEIPHAHVAIAAYVTSLARVNLHTHLTAASDRYYCDTDSIATSDAKVPTSDGLGALKLEKSFQGAEFVAPKFYAMLGTDAAPSKTDWMRAVGVDGEVLGVDALIAKKLADTGKAYERFLARRAAPKADELDRYIQNLSDDAFGVYTQHAPWATRDVGSPLYPDIRRMVAPILADLKDPNPYTTKGQMSFGFGRYAIAAKGFPALDLGDFRTLVEGGAVAVERMLRVRELANNGEISPRTELGEKRAHARVCPKRHPLIGGSTVPWSVAELAPPAKGEVPVWKTRLLAEGTWTDDGRGGKLSL